MTDKMVEELLANIDTLQDQISVLYEKLQNRRKDIDTLKSEKTEFQPINHEQFIEFIEKQIADDHYLGELGYFTFGFVEKLNELYRENQE